MEERKDQSREPNLRQFIVCKLLLSTPLVNLNPPEDRVWAGELTFYCQPKLKLQILDKIPSDSHSKCIINDHLSVYFKNHCYILKPCYSSTLPHPTQWLDVFNIVHGVRVGLGMCILNHVQLFVSCVCRAASANLSQEFYPRLLF